MPCIFCQIIAGEAEASIVYSDGHCIAFMNIRPVNPGEFMVIPRAHIDHFTDIPDDLAAHILLVGQKLGRRMLERLKPLRVGYVVHGFGVAHAHLNVVPLMQPNDIISTKHVVVKDGTFEVSVKGVEAPPRAELDRIAELIGG